MTTIEFRAHLERVENLHTEFKSVLLVKSDPAKSLVDFANTDGASFRRRRSSLSFHGGVNNQILTGA